MHHVGLAVIWLFLLPTPYTGPHVHKWQGDGHVIDEQDLQVNKKTSSKKKVTSGEKEEEEEEKETVHQGENSSKKNQPCRHSASIEIGVFWCQFDRHPNLSAAGHLPLFAYRLVPLFYLFFASSAQW